MDHDDRSWIRKTRARRYRREMTREEAMLWKYLRASGLGVPFRRQHGIGPYIADFACLQPRMVVEADGSHHFQSAYDQRRDRYIESRGFAIVRFWNEDVWERIDWVLDEIRRELHRLDPALPRPPD